jgi:hypothetical protein
MLDHSTSGGGAGANHRTRLPAFLCWGRSVSSTAPTLMAGHGGPTQGSSVGAELRTPDGGFATLFFFYVDAQFGTREVDQLEVLVDGVVVHDSGTGLGLAAQGFYSANVWADVGSLSSSSRISVRMTCDSGTSFLECLAGLVVF